LPAADRVEVRQLAERADRGQRRRAAAEQAPADPADRVLIDRIDLGDDLVLRDAAAEDQQLAGELLALREAALERHHQARLELRPGTYQLLLAGLLDQLQELVADHRHQLGGFLLAGAGVDAEQPGVGVARGEGEHRVGEAAVLAHLLEQPGRHAAAQHR